MQTLAVDLQRVTKKFGSVTAVDDLTLAIEPGEIVAFLGPNGAGKTTTIDMLLGLSRPNSGHDFDLRRQARGRYRQRAGVGGHADRGLLKDLTIRGNGTPDRHPVPARSTGR